MKARAVWPCDKLLNLPIEGFRREILAKAEELIDYLPLHGSQPQREAPIHHDDSQQDVADERWHDVARARMGYVVDSATETGWVTKYRNLIHFSVVTSAKDEYITYSQKPNFSSSHCVRQSSCTYTIQYCKNFRLACCRRPTNPLRTSGWPQICRFLMPVHDCSQQVGAASGF